MAAIDDVRKSGLAKAIKESKKSGAPDDLKKLMTRYSPGVDVTNTPSNESTGRNVGFESVNSREGQKSTGRDTPSSKFRGPGTGTVAHDLSPSNQGKATSMSTPNKDEKKGGPRFPPPSQTALARRMNAPRAKPISVRVGKILGKSGRYGQMP